jgi:hypothetical protein
MSVSGQLCQRGWVMLCACRTNSCCGELGAVVNTASSRWKPKDPNPGVQVAHSPHSVRSVLGTRPAAHSLHSLRACMLRSIYSSLPLQGLQDTCFQPVDLPLPSLLYWVPAGHRQSVGRQVGR